MSYQQTGSKSVLPDFGMCGNDHMVRDDQEEGSLLIDQWFSK